MLFLIVIACADPEPIATQTCQAVPSLSTDSKGLELLAPLLESGEFEALSAAEPTASMTEAGIRILPSLRQATQCEVDKTESAGSGHWAVTLKRTQPLVNPDGSLGEAEEQTFTWYASKTSDGVRMDIGLRKAHAMQNSIAEALLERDFKRITSTWKAMQKQFPDPFLGMEIARAEQQEQRVELASRFEAAFDRVEEGDVVAAITNPTDVAVTAAAVSFTFKSDAQVLAVVHGSTGPIAAGGKSEARGTIPAELDATVVVDVVDVEM